MNGLFDIEGEVVVITGGTGTLGGSIASSFATAGARVVILGRDEKKVEQAAASLSEFKGSIMGIVADVTDRMQLEEGLQKINDRWGEVYALINCAGGNLPGATLEEGATVLDMDLDALREVLEINLYGTVLPSIVMGNSMARGGRGSIVNLSSMATFASITRVPGYSMAKSAVENFTRWMAMEMATKFSDQIRVNCIAPGFFVGNQNRRVLLNPDGSYTDRSLRIIEKTPMRRFGSLDELNGTVHFLCSRAASFVTGTIIPVDGGFSSNSGI